MSGLFTTLRHNLLLVLGIHMSAVVNGHSIHFNFYKLDKNNKTLNGIATIEGFIFLYHLSFQA